MLTIVVLLLIALIAVVIVYGIYVHFQYTYFKRLNIPGPEPEYFFGNLSDLHRRGTLERQCLRAWTQQYGSIYGFYKGTRIALNRRWSHWYTLWLSLGHSPFICTSDVDLLLDVFIKQFSSFHSRQSLALDERHTDYVHLVHAEGERWKRQRMVVNPVFSKMKTKSMQPLMVNCLREFLVKLSQETDQDSFDILPYCKRFTMDLFWTCAFGTKTNIQSDHHNEFYKYTTDVFDLSDHKRILAYLSILLPELHSFFRFLNRNFNQFKYFLNESTPLGKYISLQQDPITWITNRTSRIIEQRLKQIDSEHIPNDLLQTLLNSIVDERNELQVLTKLYILTKRLMIATLFVSGRSMCGEFIEELFDLTRNPVEYLHLHGGRLRNHCHSIRIFDLCSC